MDINIIKLLFIFLGGLIAGIALSLVAFKYYYDDQLLSDEISYAYLPIRSFVDYHPLDIEKEYCARYKSILQSMDSLKTDIQKAHKDTTFSITLPMVRDFASNAIQQFESIPNSHIKFNCSKI